MTVLQRCILVAVAVLIVLAGLYVPFEYVDSDERSSAGYGWVFAPSDADAVVNIPQVFVAWIGAILVGGILWLAARPGTRPEKTGQLPFDRSTSETLTDIEKEKTSVIAGAKSVGHSLWKFILWALAILGILVVAVLGKEFGRVFMQ